LIDDLLKNIENKKFFNSSIINEKNQKELMDLIKKIDVSKGNLTDSDICFIKKK